METTTPTTTPEEIHHSFSAYGREEQMARMTAERRALYNRIAKRRESAGAVEHDLVASLKELRAND